MDQGKEFWEEGFCEGVQLAVGLLTVAAEEEMSLCEAF